jgi:hypothetical protein
MPDIRPRPFPRQTQDTEPARGWPVILQMKSRFLLQEFINRSN